MKNISLMAAALAATAPACAVTLTFNELATQPVQGLSTNGISFGFTVGAQTSQDAVYNRPGPTGSRFVSGTVLEEDARGELTLTFPSPMLNFGVALTSPANLAPGLTVRLLRPGAQAIGTQSFNTNAAGALSEGSFNFSGSLLCSAVIDFNKGLLATPFRFAIDNMTIQLGTSFPGTGTGVGTGTGNAVPVPPVMALEGIGLFAMGLARRRAKRTS